MTRGENHLAHSDEKETATSPPRARTTSSEKSLEI